MASEKQVTANQQNALKATGPKTAQGKRASSCNSIKWGLCCKEVLLPDESEVQFAAFSQWLMDDLRPVGALEQTLADLLIAGLWRWSRAHRIETGLFQMYRVYENQDRGVQTAFAHDASNMDCLSRLTRYETTLERRTLKLLHELQRLQAARAGQPVTPPLAVDVTGEVNIDVPHGTADNEIPAA